MATELSWLGHGTWFMASQGKQIILDPFLDDNPMSPLKSDAVSVDYILISHGHFDHVADAEKIAQRTGAMVIANFEICQWLAGQGIENSHAMNIGGGYDFPFGRVKMTIAHHSSMLPDGSNGGNPCGFLITFEEGVVYFACDTGLFHDMQLIGHTHLDLAVLPIGDNFTMGPGDALEAVKLLAPRRVVPVHANTWPVIQADVHAWADQVLKETQTEAVVLEPGQQIILSQ